MKKISVFLSVLIIIFSHIAYSQPLQTNVWYFGHYAGLKFVNGNPVALSNGQIDNTEGSSVLCDNYGNLLFYTDGITVWDKNHNPMPNGTGLNGNTSSTQTLLVKKPGNCMQYYIFYTDGQVLNNSYYSVVDLILNGGLGDVVTASKNTFLHHPATEKITSVVHQNGTDVWVIFHELYSNKFMSYLISSTGLNAIPVTSNAGLTHTNMIGYMKVSHNGNKLATAVTFTPDSRAEVYDFDKLTGIVSNPVVFNNWDGAYGIEFSPNDSILYVSKYWTSNELYQIDLTNLSPSSYTSISSGSNVHYDYCALQLGPNGKIYMARGASGGQNYLSVINNPNTLGAGCNFVNNGFTLATGTYGVLGLPTFHQGLFNYHTNDFTFSSTNCLTFDFLSSINGPYDSLSWNFGDVISGSNNFSNALNPQHTFSGTNNFNVTLIIYTECYNDTIQHLVNVTTSVVPVNLGNDTTICNSSSLALNAGNPVSSYLWSTGDTTQIISVSLTGSYWVSIINSGCTGSDTIDITFASPLIVSLGNDTTLCSGNSLILNAGNPVSSYLWSTGDTTQIISVSASGNYWVFVTNGSCSGKDTINVSFVSVPVVSLGNDTVLCPDASISLNAGNSVASYLWSTGAVTQSIIVFNPGTYWVKVTIGNCVGADTINISKVSDIELGSDVSLCNEPEITLDAGNMVSNYLWSTGDTTQTIMVAQPGEYWVKSNYKNCVLSDTVKVTDDYSTLYLPNTFTPDENGINDIFRGYGEGITFYDLKIFSRWGEFIFETKDINTGWDGTYKGRLVQIGIYVWVLDYQTVCSDKNIRKYGYVMLLK
ncbi:MAG: gliding motility-associated C-terminal domain-containing protein [Bacteroidales bacterium]